MWVICAAVNVVLNIIRGDFLENLIGKRFGRLLVLSETTLPKGKWKTDSYNLWELGLSERPVRKSRETSK